MWAISSYAQIALPDTAQSSHEIRAATGQQVPKEQLNKGIVYNLEQLLTGQFAGLRVVPAGGAPGTGAEMVLRSGTSLYGNNSPLLVIDGVLLDLFSHSLHTSNLSFLNSEDIASVSLLKDASATALYGGAAANGVLLITTKSGKAGDKMRLQYNATGAVSSLRKRADIFSAEEFRSLIRERYPDQQRLLGKHNTDWQDEIYRTGFGVAHNLSLSGAMGTVPYRVSVGQVKQDGIMETSGYKRNTLALNLQPSLFQKHLTFNLSLLNTGQEIRLADERAIPAAMAFDPTQPVYADNKYGGYFTHMRPDGYVLNGQINPVSLLEQKKNRDEIRTLSGQAYVQYRFHFLPSLSANYRYAYFKSDSDYRSDLSPDMAFRQGSPIDFVTHGLASKIAHSEGFITLNQAIPAWNSKLDLTAGALKTKRDNETESAENNREHLSYARGRHSWSMQENFSYYGSLGYTLQERLTFRASFRNLSDLNYKEDAFRHRAMAAGISWNVRKESSLANSNFISHLKLKADVGSFSRLDEPNRFRTVLWSPMHRSPFDYEIIRPYSKSETEKTLEKSLGLEFGLMQNRLSGIFNVFQNKSRNLLIPVRLAGNAGQMHISSGALKISGLESSLQYNVIQKESAYLKVGMHATLLKNRVTSIVDFLDKITFSDNDYGLALVEGKPAHVFDLYKHLYDENGKPIQGGYEKGEFGYTVRIPMGSNQPNAYYGLSSNGGYGRWEMSFLMRGAAGHQVHNFADGRRSWLYANDRYDYLSNASRSYLETGFIGSHSESSHFLENASFLRLEYLQLAYNFGKVLGNKADLKVNATAQNAFVLTRYSGQDPEVANGIDRGQYPQPRTFSLGLNLSL